MTTVAQLRVEIAQLDDVELLTKLELYQGLQSKGVRDEIMTTLLEDEFYNLLCEIGEE